MNAGIQDSAFLSVSEPLDLTDCDREPIHAPSCIQPHGMLIVARDGDREILYTSANSLAMMGVAPALLLQHKLPALLGETAMAAIELSLREESAFSTRILTLSFPFSKEAHFDVMAHQADGLLYIELEPADEHGHWGALSEGIEGIIGEFRNSTSLKDLCWRAVSKIRHTTGYDRVMLYRFDRDAHGEVLAEDKADGMEPFLGLQFPAGDIPVQARKLYLLQKLRLIVDVAQSPVPVLARPSFMAAEPLDMTYCGLRGISPIHLQYLSNMGVGGTLCISLVHQQQLWGMIVCHHRTAKRPAPQIRALTGLLGELMSMLITVMEQSEQYAERLAKQQLLAGLSAIIQTGPTVSACLAGHADQLLALVNANGAWLCVGGHTQTIGDVPAEAAAIMKAFRARLTDGIAASDEVGAVFPQFASSAATASGALMVQFINRPGDGILWFRREIARTVYWGGNPDQAKEISLQTGSLSPRLSFAAWEQIQRGRSKPWTKAEIDATQELQRIITASMLHRAEAELARLSHYDPLTNLPNRRVLLNQLTEWQASGTILPAALLFLDLDNFKSVNDSLGHDAGDELLKQVAERLVLCAEGKYLVARLGGDEFVLFCRNTPAHESAGLAASIIKEVALPFVLQGKPFRTMVSIGIAAVSESTQLDHADSLRAADQAMYVAKQNGGNQAAVYDSPQHDRIVRQAFLEQALFEALARHEFEVVYQPQVTVSTGSPVGFEALVRWRHPEFGIVMPGEFIPMAEKLGLISAIGYWVLEQSLKHIKRWRGLFEARLSISVNISAQQVIKPDCCALVQELLRRTALPSSALCLEVTETMLMQDLAVEQVLQLRAHGVRVSIDDFGTGYSSLAYLQRIPVDEVKIDRSLMFGVGEDPRKTALLGAIVQLAHTLDLQVVAEGVESTEQWDALRAGACDCAQGYYIARPMTAEAMDAWLTEEGKREMSSPSAEIAFLYPRTSLTVAGRAILDGERG